MAVSDRLEGKNIILDPVSVEDAKFTMDIRADEALNEFIPCFDTTEEKQRAWIESQRAKAGDYFYIIKSKSGEKRGTCAIYDVDTKEDIAEYGRFISYGNALENVEAALLVIQYAFAELGITRIMLNNDARNKRIISFWRRFGAEYDGDYDYGTWTAARYIITKAGFESSRAKIDKMLERV